MTTASFCGLRAVWPPYRTGWDGWVSVALPIAVGSSRATHAIRAADPEALVVHVEASTSISAATPDHEHEAALLGEIGWLPTDLMLGHVDETHPLRSWMLDHGADRSALDELVRRPATVDVLGVNYYPDLTPRRLREVDGRVLQITYDGGAEHLARALRGFAGRYGLPLAVTETSIEGDDDTRADWVRAAVSTVLELSDELDVRGFTWWPLLDFVDWSWAADGANVEEFAVESTGADGTLTVDFAPPLGTPEQGKTPFLRRMGLLRLEEQPDGSLTRRPTNAAHAFTALASLEQVRS